jgi:hypothetical protein
VTSPQPGAAPTPEENRPINTSPTTTTTGRRTVRLAALPSASGTPLLPTQDVRGTSGARSSSAARSASGARSSSRAAATADSGTLEAGTRPDTGAHRATRPHLFPTSRDAWLVLAERVVGDWAATLRTALLLVLAVAAAIMVIGLVFGLGPAVATAILAVLVFLAGRRRGGSVHR